MQINNYLLKSHKLFFQRLSELKHKVKKLKKTTSLEEYRKHPSVKLFGRVKDACLNTIPSNPNVPEYYLKQDLAKFRRFKRGLQRNRLLFCFSNKPPIILYLFLNDEKSLRKNGSKSDPYSEFKRLVNKGVFSADPNDPKMQKWISQLTV